MTILSKLQGTRVFRAIRVGFSGTTIKNIVHGTVAVNPGSIATVTRGTIAFTVTGAAAGDAFIIEPPAALAAGLVYAGYVVTANTVTLHIYNSTGDAVDDTERTWRYTWIDLT